MNTESERKHDGRNGTVFNRLRQVRAVAMGSFRVWHKNPRVYVTFFLGFILCFLLTDKAMSYAVQHGTVLQILEPFIWTFGDGNAILLSSMLLLLLFSDMPFITPGTPYYLIRTTRRVWLAGQVLYTMIATFIYLVFMLFSSVVLCMTNAFPGDMWSKTAAILGYSGDGQAVALPMLIKVLERSTPYRCTATVFLLMLFYTLCMVFLMLWLNLRKGYAAGMAGGFVFTLFSFFMSPDNLIQVFSLPDELAFRARVWMGWLSPLNHATYAMHNFGYDRLPKLWQTYAVFGVLLAALLFCCLRAIRCYQFSFRGM